VTPCPRCGRENPATAPFCAGCRTPLSFEDGPLAARLDVDLHLDRRQREREPGGAPEGAPFLPDRSDWELGAREELPARLDPEPPTRGAPLAAADGPEEPEEGGSDAHEGDDSLRPAAPLRRAAAWAVDGGLLAGAAAGLSAVLLTSTGGFERAGSIAGAVAAGLPIVLPACAFVAIAGFVYATVAHTLAGATLGKRLAGLRVVDADGQPPGPACSAARSAWLVASLALAGAGLLPALVTPSRRALHDLLAGTRVVDAP
jgi:uncharacterized RDD family membrane protein YckC